MSAQSRYLIPTILAGVLTVVAVIALTVNAASHDAGRGLDGQPPVINTGAPTPSDGVSAPPERSTDEAAPSPAAQGPQASPSPTGPQEFVLEQGWKRSTVTSPAIPKATRIAVLVEDGLPIDAPEAARLVLSTLMDERGWAGEGYKFDLVATPAEATVTVRIATPASVDKGCAPMETNGYVSCSVGPIVWLNSDRWLHAVPGFNNDVATYRTYLISHEVGHSLGYHHIHCDTPGKPAPVMQQQTLDLEGCLPNGWVTRARVR